MTKLLALPCLLASLISSQVANAGIDNVAMDNKSIFYPEVKSIRFVKDLTIESSSQTRRSDLYTVELKSGAGFPIEKENSVAFSKGCTFRSENDLFVFKRGTYRLAKRTKLFPTWVQLWVEPELKGCQEVVNGDYCVRPIYGEDTGHIFISLSRSKTQKREDFRISCSLEKPASYRAIIDLLETETRGLFEIQWR